MTKIIHWDDNDPHILWTRFEQPFTVKEYTERCLESIGIIRAAQHRVDVMFYVTAPLPQDNMMQAMRQLVSELSTLTNLGIIVSIYPNSNIFMNFAMKIIHVVLYVYNANLEAQLPFVKTVDEGYALIARARYDMSVSS